MFVWNDATWKKMVLAQTKVNSLEIVFGKMELSKNLTSMQIV